MLLDMLLGALTIGLISIAAAWIWNLSMGALVGQSINHLSESDKREAVKVNQRWSLKYNCNFDQIFFETTCAIKALEKSKIVISDKRKKYISARIGMSWSSVGEKIKVRFRDDGHGIVSIYLTSKPRLTTTTIDYGKNFKNIEDVTSFLDRKFTNLYKESVDK